MSEIRQFIKTNSFNPTKLFRNSVRFLYHYDKSLYRGVNFLSSKVLLQVMMLRNIVDVKLWTISGIENRAKQKTTNCISVSASGYRSSSKPLSDFWVMGVVSWLQNLWDEKSFSRTVRTLTFWLLGWLFGNLWFLLSEYFQPPCNRLFEVFNF